MAESVLALLFAPASHAGDGASRDPRRDPIRDPIRARTALEGLPADDQIVALVRAGHESILEQLFRAHAAGLVAFVGTYVRSDDVAWEIVQDVFLWLVAHRETWHVQGTVRAYLYTAARHGALNHLKHGAVERRWSEQAQRDAMAASLDRPDAGLYDEERRRALIAAIGKLAESRRTTLALRYGHNLSYAEIASVVGSSIKAVENQLNRTLHQLRELLEPPAGPA